MKSAAINKGRSNQKKKTRARIVNAAKKLMSDNRNVSIEEVADEAKISRATIYRYFTNIDLLCTEASLDIHFLTHVQLFDKVKDWPLTECILFIQNYYNNMAQEHELIFRRYLSATLIEPFGSNKKIRGARRVEAMSLVLEPYKSQMSKTDLDNLKNISTILMGIEPVIVSKDVCRLQNNQTNDTLKWGIEMILKGMNIDFKDKN